MRFPSRPVIGVFLMITTLVGLALMRGMGAREQAQVGCIVGALVFLSLVRGKESWTLLGLLAGAAVFTLGALLLQ